MGQVARMTTFRGLPPPASGATFDIVAEARLMVTDTLASLHF